MSSPASQRSLPRAAWPLADRLAWEAALAPGTLIRGGGAAAHLAAVTVQDLERRYACFLAFAQARGLLAVDGCAANTVSEAAIRIYINDVSARIASVTVAGSIRKILRVATLLSPERDWGWLQRFASRLEANQVARDKRPRLVDVRQLHRLGLRLMEQAEADSRLTPFEQAQLYRDGLIIALLAACQLRLGVFSRLEIGGTISRGASSWTIHIPAVRGTKYHRATEKPLPTALTERIDRWIAIYRPSYAKAARTPRLWLSRCGPISADRINQIIGGRTMVAFGRSVNPHLFRDCGATTINTFFSGESHLASAVLDHVDPRVTQKHYNHARMVDAVRAHQRSLGLRD